MKDEFNFGLQKDCLRCKKKNVVNPLGNKDRCRYCNGRLNSFYSKPNLDFLISPEEKRSKEIRDTLNKVNSLQWKKSCPQCKKKVNSLWDHCGYCGASLKPKLEKPKVESRPIFCPKCKEFLIDLGTPIGDPNKSYCPKCGHRLGTPSINFQPISKPSQQQSGDCFIATACKADAKTLNTFYELRDRILLPSQTGRKFVQLYYQYAPGIASIIQSHEQLQKSILRGFLKPLAAVLKNTVLGDKDS
jgi:rRNA maturation endonuclease Nob1